jgi:hypothetical protein
VLGNSDQTITFFFLIFLFFGSLLDLSIGLGLLVFQQFISSINSILSVIRVFPNKETNVESNSEEGVQGKPDPTTLLVILVKEVINEVTNLWEEVG